MGKVFERRRNLVVGMLNKAEGLHCATWPRRLLRLSLAERLPGQDHPGGRKLETDADFVEALLEEEGVAAVHGSAFMFPGHFRISYATDDATLVEACTRIQRFCAGLK